MDKQEVRQRSSSTASPSSLSSSSHQRRWSNNFGRRSSSPVIIIKKNVKEPQPPQREVSLVRSQTPSCRSAQRYSYPNTGIRSSPSCSSPVQTAVIMGHDPRGWKLRPKSCISSMLSLQMPLPVPIPDPSSLPFIISSPIQSDPSLKSKPPLESKPFRRHHSDSSALLRSMSLVTLEELRDVRLRPTNHLDEPDDVFGEAYAEGKVSPRSHKMPPAVPQKTLLARQKAQLIAQSWQRQRCATPKSELYSVIKPKPKLQQQADIPCTLHPKTNSQHFKG
nr:uncharacterized protein LOC133610719 [Nerophis lumbriciformis]